MKNEKINLDKQHRYPWPVIETAVQYHLSQGLAYRLISEKMEKLGVIVSHKTIYEWVQKFSDQVKAKKTGKNLTSYSVEESYVKCNGEWMYMYCAFSKNDLMGIFLREKKNKVAANNFFKKFFAAE